MPEMCLNETTEVVLNTSSTSNSNLVVVMFKSCDLDVVCL